MVNIAMRGYNLYRNEITIYAEISNVCLLLTRIVNEKQPNNHWQILDKL